MLAWKWWHDCRGRACVYLGAALALGVLAALDATAFNWWIYQFRDSQRLNFYLYLSWSRIGSNLSSPAWLGAMWMGLALAISSLGRDYASPAGAFLLTRPRSRIAVLWTDWAMSVVLILAAGAALIGGAAAMALRSLPWISNAGLWTLLPSMFAVGMVVYALALFWTVVTRSASRGIELSVATMLIASLAPGALLEWWHIGWPDEVQKWMTRIFDWSPMYTYWIYSGHRLTGPNMYRNPEAYPLATLAIWIGIGLALTYATQKIMERREV